MSKFAEQISNEVSEFIAETRANKRARLMENSQGVDLGTLSIPGTQTTSVPDQFQPYREALAVLMGMYNDGKFTIDEVTTAIELLENTPIHCITLVGLTAELREGWLKRAMCVKAQSSQVLN